eukprot:332137-Chlamydomonas_euryale.AAC.1
MYPSLRKSSARTAVPRMHTSSSSDDIEEEIHALCNRCGSATASAALQDSSEKHPSARQRRTRTEI